MKLFLDDVRHPQDCLMYMHRRIGKLNPIYAEEWVIVRNYVEFCATVKENVDIITHISFDHDLADIHYDPTTWTESFIYHEETGYDCALYVKEYYAMVNNDLPIMFVHSMNAVGTERIINLFKK